MNVDECKGITRSESRPVVSVYQQASELSSGSGLSLWSQQVFSVPAWISTCSPAPEMKTPHCPQECQPPLSDLLKNKVWNTISSYLTIHQTTAPYSLKGNRQRQLPPLPQTGHQGVTITQTLRLTSYWRSVRATYHIQLHYFVVQKERDLYFALGFFLFVCFPSKEQFFIHPLLAARNNTAFKN